MKKLKMFTAVFITASMLLSICYRVSVSADTIKIDAKDESSDRININDQELKNVILDILEKDKDYNITKEDMQSITEINAYYKEIRNIDELKYCENLKVLNLDNNYISDISSIYDLKNLESLSICNNEITSDSLSSLTSDSLTGLGTLYMSGNDLGNDGLKYLSRLRNLYTLQVCNSNISDIECLANLKCLTNLSLHTNYVSDLSALKDLNRLEYLSVTDNNLDDSNKTIETAVLKPLEGKTNLEQLELYDNNIEYLQPLKDSKDTLKELTLFDNNISDISPLGDLTKLERLTLSNNNITDITALSNLTELKDLTLSYNKISDISALTSNTKLTSLTLSNNSIYDASPLSVLKNLRKLSLAGQKAEVNLRVFENKDGECKYYTNNPVVSINKIPVPVFKVSNGGKYVEYNSRNPKLNNIIKLKTLDSANDLTFNFNYIMDTSSYSTEFSGEVLVKKVN